MSSIVDNMQHVDFPVPEKGTPPTSGYLKNFADGSWKLHVIQRNDTTDTVAHRRLKRNIKSIRVPTLIPYFSWDIE